MASSSGTIASRRSVVWHFFKEWEDDHSMVVCQLCGTRLARGGSSERTYSTTNLRKHLTSKHNKELMEKERLLEEASSPRPAKLRKAGKDEKKQQTIEQTLERKKIWDINSSNAKEIHYKIGEMMALDCQPFSIVEDLGFCRLMKKLQPSYRIPGRKYFSENIIPSIYGSVFAQVQKIIQSAENISFTTDIWTSGAGTGDAFISLTAHCLDKEFEQQTAVLRVCPFKETHTAANITEIIHQILIEFDIPLYKTHVFLRDNGSNMVKGIKDSGHEGLSCFLHTLQLVIKDCVLEQRMVKEVISQCKRRAGHFSHSPLACHKLEELQKEHRLPIHKIMQDVQTRWNSTYFLLERMSEQKSAIASYCVDTPNLPVFDANKWSLIEKVSNLLKVFHRTTAGMSERSSTASEIIPQIKFLKMFIGKAKADPSFSGLGTMLAAIEASMATRFDKYIEDNNTVLATFLDPRYKSSFFWDAENPSSVSNEANILQNLINSWNDRRAEEMSAVESDSASTGTHSSEDNRYDGTVQDNVKDFDFDACFQQVVVQKSKPDKTKKPAPHQNDAIKGEVERYLNMDRQPHNGDPLRWWKENKVALPSLGQLANKYLSAPPSSIESERLFSIGGNIYSPHRNRLKADTGESLMFLNYNLRITHFKY